jgi:serine/threonine protein kinase
VAHVLSWLSSLSLSQYTSSFSDASVDGETLIELARERDGGEELLVAELGVGRKIHRMKIVREIRKLAQGNAAAPAASIDTAAAKLVPLSTSISNPLPSASAASSGAAGTTELVASSSSSAADAPPGHAQPHSHSHPPARWEQTQAPTQIQAQAQTHAQPSAQAQAQARPSSVALFPAASMAVPAPSSAALFPARPSASPTEAATPAPAPASAGIFSSSFDFDNLANLAPLSSVNSAGGGGGGASSPSSSLSASSGSSGARDRGASASSAAPTPSGSGGQLPPTTHSHSHASSQVQVRPSVGNEYSPMHQTDLLAHSASSSASAPATAVAAFSSAVSAASAADAEGGSSSGSQSPPPRDQAMATTTATAALSPQPTSRAQRQPLPAGHVPRRIPYSELTLQEVIGQGQFGTVWRGTWRGASVAIKKLHLDACVLASSAAASVSGSGVGGGGGSVSGPGSVAQEQFGLFMREAALHQAVGNHPNLIGFIGISLPAESPASESAASALPPSPRSAHAEGGGPGAGVGSSSGVAPPHLCSDEPAAGDVCIVTHYFPLGSVRDLLVTRRTLSLLPPAALASESERRGGPRGDAPLPLLTLLRMLRDIACGVLHLHLEGCIHRDLAARNFLVDQTAATAVGGPAGAPGLAVRVADFGMSRLLLAQQQGGQTQQAQCGGGGGEGEGSLSSASASAPSSSGSAPWSSPSAFTHSQVGPLKWMAPESILRHAYSARSDSYAFGVAGWELLAGQAEPYAGVLPLEAAIRAAHDEAFRPEIAPEVPRPLAGLLRRCWAHQPDRRPPFEKILNSLQRMERFLADKISRQHSAAATAAAAVDDQQRPAAHPNPWSPECWADYPDSDSEAGSL